MHHGETIAHPFIELVDVRIEALEPHVNALEGLVPLLIRHRVASFATF
jgi:hypothetical protein